MDKINRLDFIKTMGLGSMFFLTPTLLLNKNLNENIIEGIYTPGWKAITPSGIDDLISTIDRNQLNTLMVNVKNARGEIKTAGGFKWIYQR